MLYKFLNNISIDTLHIVEQKHIKDPKSLSNEEEDLLSSAHIVHVYLHESLGEGHAEGKVTRKELELLMNKEKYHEHTHSYAD